ncbi:MAG: hypothetical protein U0325_23865 [Polyangiales bacterium]
MDRLPRPVRSLALALVAVAFAAVTWRAMLLPLDHHHGGDWGYFEHMWEATRVQGFALWDPFHCGGVSLWHNPQWQSLHPLYALTWVLGARGALKVFFAVHVAVGFAGMFRLARARGDGRAAAFTAAAVWAGSGFFAWHGVTGHSTFAAFLLAPWALLAWRRAEGDVRGAVAVAGVFTAALLAGGTYPVPYLALLLALDALPRLRTRSGREGVVRAAAVALPLTLLLAAVRVVPIVEALRREPRVMRERDSVSLHTLAEMLLARDHAYDSPQHNYAWDEYGAYIGVGALALAALGCVIALRRKHFALPMGALLFAGLTLGDGPWWRPWSLLRHLPIYESLRVPSRFAVVLTLYLALLAASGLDALARALRARGARRLAAALPWAVALTLAADLTAVSRDIIEGWRPPAPLPAPAARFHLVSDRGYFDEIASLPARNVGSVGCYEPMGDDVPDSLWTGDTAQARIEDVGAVRRDGRDPFGVWAEVTLPRPGRVVFNQRWNPDWRADHGTVVADDGRLAVALPAGVHRVRVRYAPRSVLPSLAVTAVGLLIAAALLRPRKSLRDSLRGAGAAPRDPR